jgi:hypothetical protein
MLVGALLNMVGTWVRAIAIICPVGLRFPIAMVGQVILISIGILHCLFPLYPLRNYVYHFTVHCIIGPTICL